jgi:crotonobetainyl-CoA:carnitine CoA-transferase CaiB-like acyl-CoA transferase
MTDKLPLQGITVVEFGGSVAGPFAGWVLAELGAEVFKVERPEGDDSRGWGPPFYQGSSSIFHALNRNKRSVVADLTDPETVRKLRRFIVERADAVLQNMRTGALAKYGFDAEGLLAENPRLIYCNLNAYGTRGPYAEKPGYDLLMQGMAGIMSVTGEPEGEPVRAGVSVVDEAGGFWCVTGLLAALHRRQETGKGGIVDASLYETALTWMAYHSVSYQLSGKVPERQGSGLAGVVPYQAYACADGYLIVAAPNDRLFGRLSEVLGHPEWPQDVHFASSSARWENKAALNALLTEALGRERREHWRPKLDAVGIPCAPIQSVDEVLAHPQTEAVELLQPSPDGQLKLTGLPLRFDGARPPLRNVAPKLGADTGEVMG